MANNQKLDLNKYLPSVLKNDTLTSLVSNVFNRFVSEEQSVTIDGRIGKPLTGDAQIQAIDQDHQLNALVPAIYYKTGTVDNVFTFEDLLNKLTALDTDVSNMHKWMAEQPFALSFPISYDKFINYTNYFWVGKQVKSLGQHNWNPTMDPEFYLIARPKPTDTAKLPVRLATTQQISFYANDRPPETFTITFTSSNSFTVTSDIAQQRGETINASAYIIDSSAGGATRISLSNDQPLCSFTITTGGSGTQAVPFSAGDFFTLTLKYFTSQYSVSLTAPSITNKGTLTGITTDSAYMKIDGVTLLGDERILVKNQADSSQNGIYTVKVGEKWERSPDSNTTATLVDGSIVYVTDGLTQAGYTYTINHAPQFTLDDLSAGHMDITVLTSSAPSNINQWQEFNFWIHRDDFALFPEYDFNAAIRANRPIIEYSDRVQLNSFYDDNGVPGDQYPQSYEQQKTALNQLPQFDIYRYDGTHHGATSGIFYYVEDPDFTTDSVLHKRVKLTANYDYIFGHSLVDDLGRLLYYKLDGALCGPWQAGAAAPTVISRAFSGTAAQGEITVTPKVGADNQSWSVVAVSTTSFTVTGSRSGTVGTLAVGTPFECDDCTILVSATGGFDPGQVFTFEIQAPVAPRFVEQLSSGQIINYPGGPAADAASVQPHGQWLTPLRMFENLGRETRTEIAAGDMLNHVRSVLQHQDGFTGSSFGINNSRDISFNPGYGGTIRDFGSNFPLLASMLIQQDISPISIIDFAEQQYSLALANIDAYLSNNLAQFMTENGPVTAANTSSLMGLLAAYEATRAADITLQPVFNDTTCAVSNWPATLPCIGLLPATQPGIVYDSELGVHCIQHHDGHRSLIAVQSAEVNLQIAKTQFLRSDGLTTAGLFQATQPTTPYAGQYWYNTTTGELSVFAVKYDTSSVGTTDGDLWYNRQSGVISTWSTTSQTWTATNMTVAQQWVVVDPALIRNSLVVAVENKIYSGIVPEQAAHIHIDLMAKAAYSAKFSEIELARYAAKYGYDIYGTDYSASNAFAWNYKGATVVGLSATPARWYDIYESYFARGLLSLTTARPDIEPWKLLGNATMPTTWSATYQSTATATSNTTTARVVVSSVTGLTATALPVAGDVVDGVKLSTGDIILLANAADPAFNGLYEVSASTIMTSTPLVHGLTVSITEGSGWAGSQWVLTSDTTGFIFEQIKTWKSKMWVDIMNSRPGMKLCVNLYTDELLPPYVSASLMWSDQALLTSIPPGISSTYSFGDNGPVELNWKKSLEFRYGAARTAFRLDPLYFLDRSWGETYVTTPGTTKNVRVERNTLQPLSSSNFLLHGEKLNIIQNLTPAEAALRIATGGYIFSGDVVTVDFTVKYVDDNVTTFYMSLNGTTLDSVNVGQVIPYAEYTVGNVSIRLTSFGIVDRGYPFSIGDKLSVTVLSSTSYTSASSVTFTPAATKVILGVGQWFTHLLRYNLVDTDFSSAVNAFRKWELKLAHRLGALIRSDSLSINTAQGYLPSTAFNIILKKTANTQSTWYSALRVQLMSYGAGSTILQGQTIPSFDASDWKFRVEVYNPQNPMVERYELDTTGGYQTFFALNKKSTPQEWKRFTDKLDTVTTAMPITITGMQNVLNFMYGYIDRLEDLGWTSSPADGAPAVDATTGRAINWQLEVEKFIDSVYSGMDIGAGHILNPSMSRLILNTPVGLMGTYSSTAFTDVYSAQGAYDVIGSRVPLSNLTVIRTDDQAITTSTTPIFSAHVFIDKYEHVILFNQRFSSASTAATVFDPFLGVYIDTAYLNFVRQAVTDRKPTFPGFFLSGNNVSRNIVSSVDNIASYYDTRNTFADKTTSSNALALLGFEPKDYFTSITANDVTKFNFWRGLIQAKGTNLTVDAFVNYKKFISASVDEFWAYKLAEYGDAREKTFPEIKINPTDVAQKFARLQFYTKGSANYDTLPLFTQIEAADDTRWFTIDDLGKSLKFDASEIAEQVVVSVFDPANPYIRLQNIYHNGDSVAPTVSGPAGALVIGASLLKVAAAGTYTVTGYTWLNPSKLSPVKLFDYSTNTLDAEIGLWHPAIGIHAYQPLEIVNMIQGNDPAQYNYTTQTVDNPNFRKLRPWQDREVGRVWWDTSNLGYVPYYDATIFPNRDNRDSRWGALADWASVDLYEWTQSSVHPSKYDALAASQAGNSSIDQSLRASGTAALKKYYSRNRIIKIRPIAWSQVGQPGNAAGTGHPAFGPSLNVTVYANSTTLIADIGRCADIGLTPGRGFAAWNVAVDVNGNQTGKPVGEVVLTSTIGYDIGTAAQLSVASFTGGANISTVTVQPITRGNLGSRIGTIYLKQVSDSATSTQTLRMLDSTGSYSDAIINDWYSNDLVANSTRTIPFIEFGLTLTITRSVTGTLTAAQIIADVVTNPDIFIRETISYTEVIPLPTSVNGFSNLLSVSSAGSSYGWKSWNIPTQAQLTADLAAPMNIWQPYLGDLQTVAASPDIVAKLNAPVLTLSSGVPVTRFSTSWTDWTTLQQVRQEKISDGVTALTFTLPESIDSNRLSLYIDGVQVNPGGYSVAGSAVTMSIIPAEGSAVYLLYRNYQPTSKELAFDPATSDDFSIQVQYKLDYQYTVVDVRDGAGNISGQVYYFWVQDKTVPQVGKSMSLAQAAAILKEGPTEYVIFARALPTTAGAAFDSCSIAGLSYLVTKNDSYKIRFVRDFTLRDDPEEIKLKNTHTEWVLIRKGQTYNIPLQLWNVLTDSVAGQDAAGNQLPSKTRTDYDLRNGTLTRFGFGKGQVFADTLLVRASVLNTILNTALTIEINGTVYPDTINALDFTKSDTWFASGLQARATMKTIWASARPAQINEIFFSVLDDALANNYEFSDLFKTSLITVSSSTLVDQSQQQEIGYVDF